ncbi:MAG TPA: hypothetical protein DCL97_02065, partial [Dehalococcoidia bacterium]|nr:hypothetical protein [Dehalococcoidia bacterium]
VVIDEYRYNMVEFNRRIRRSNIMAQKTVATPIVEVDNVPACAHHWVIQPAMGPSSQGICQICGESKDFQNYVEAASWGDSRHTDRSEESSKEVLAVSKSSDEDEEEE